MCTSTPCSARWGKNSIDFDLIESQFRHLMRVAVSVREEVISFSTLFWTIEPEDLAHISPYMGTGSVRGQCPG
ncbi:hypothetical protein [Streptomyces sp. NPDC090053]|uniref:hypothetical protein n=1 Tax=Streptomyces sp. NPDC090053 TaxID=3365932 RepID=UPI00380BDEB3